MKTVSQLLREEIVLKPPSNIVWHNEGRGAVPDFSDEGSREHFGIRRVYMHPRQFLNLAGEGGADVKRRSYGMWDHAKAGGSFAPPSLTVYVHPDALHSPDEEHPHHAWVADHEGRARSQMALDAGHRRIPVDLRVKSDYSEVRGKHVTPELMRHLNHSHWKSQRGHHILVSFER